MGGPATLIVSLRLLNGGVMVRAVLAVAVLLLSPVATGQENGPEPVDAGPSDGGDVPSEGAPDAGAAPAPSPVPEIPAVPAQPEAENTVTAPATGGVAEPASQEQPDTAEAQTTVRAKRPRQAASSSTVRDRDFLLRPHPRPADILQTVPGFYVVQHSGGGKANQYFLRGFDADHGTDVAISVDGVPVNLVSHGHGQGYTDINWIIPETVQRLDVKKGPYFADVGDFGTGGAVNMVTKLWTAA